MKGLGERMIRAAKLDRSLYEEVKADRRAPMQAAMVGWYAWAFFTYLVGTRLLQEPQTKIDFGATVRMISFASAPGVVSLLGIIPGLSGVVFGLVLAWMLGAMIIAVRETLRYTTTFRAVGACVIGWVMQWLFMGILLSLRGPAPGA